MQRRLRITSLGSSFAAGPSILPLENQAAGRSARNYAHQLASRVDADLTDLTVSGATLLNVLNEKQSIGDCTFDPQLQHLPVDTDIVTLTCGGNDLGYIGSLVHQTLVSYVGPRHAMVSGTAVSPALTRQELTARLLAVIDRIHTISPGARVYLVQYLSVIGDQTRPLYDLALTADHIQAFDGVAKLLAQAYVDVADERPDWVEVVPVAGVSRVHGLGSKEPWIRGFSLEMLLHDPAPYHPNILGHTAIADMLYAQIVRGMFKGRP